MKKYRLFCLPTVVMVFHLTTLMPSSAQTSTASPSPDEVSARIVQLTNKTEPVPENELLLFEENRRIGQEIETARRNLNSLETDGQLFDQLKKHEDTARKLFQEVDSLNCNSAETNQVRTLTVRYDKLVDEIQTFIFFNDLGEVESTGDNPWTTNIDGQPLLKQPSCPKLKEISGTNDQAKRQALLGFTDRIRRQIETIKEANKPKITQLNSLLDLLKQRQAEIQDKLKKDTQQQISGDLWKVILAIGALSIGVIFVIKVFAEDTQIEWVASGQVIQFVTVVVLLCVIMALGLANILKENTLGTLLGGIAGYVLSQGVGRAAAREVSRRLGALTNPVQAPGDSSTKSKPPLKTEPSSPSASEDAETRT